MWWRTKHERSEWQHFRQGLSSRETTSIILVDFIGTPNDGTHSTPILLPQENPIVWEDYGTGGIIIGGPYKFYGSFAVPGRVPRWICTPKCSVGGHHDMELTEVDPYRCSAEQVAGSLETCKLLLFAFCDVSVGCTRKTQFRLNQCYSRVQFSLNCNYYKYIMLFGILWYFCGLYKYIYIYDYIYICDYIYGISNQSFC